MASPYEDVYEEWKALGRPGGSFSAWQASQSGAPAVQAAVQPVPGAQLGQPAGTPTADWLRQNAQSQGWSEDFARFNDPTLAGWAQYWDQGAGKFRSMRGAEGFFEKPTECPPGQVPSGPNETDPCIPNPGANEPNPGTSPLNMVMQSAQVDPVARPVAPAAGPYGGFMGGQGVPKAPGAVSRPVLAQDSLQAAITPIQGAVQKPLPGGVSPLQQMMAPIQSRKRQVGLPSWFGG